MSSPLAGKRIVLTRPMEQAQASALVLRREGAIPILFPTIQIAPIQDFRALDHALNHLDHYEAIIFTSVNGVQKAVEGLKSLHRSPLELEGRLVAVTGQVTRQALQQVGIKEVICPDSFSAEALLDLLLAEGRVKGRRFLLLRADLAHPALPEGLKVNGAEVDQITVYRTLPGEPDPAAFAELRRGVDAITFASASSARNFALIWGAATQSIVSQAQVVCIGHVTAQGARQAGLRVDHCASEYTFDGLIETLRKSFRI